MLKIEIWTDILCPWCYIGKRQFEHALEQFPHKNEVELLYRSFELDPNARKEPGMDSYELLAKKYGVTHEKAAEMHKNVTARAADVGLEYHMEITKPTNSFDAHRLIHLAAAHGLQGEIVEKLSAAYLTEGKHIGRKDTLQAIGVEAGLAPAEVQEMLAGEAYADAVRADENLAQQLGIQGVPFFVIERKYGASGAQGTEVFRQLLEKTWEEFHVAEQS